MRIAVTGAGSFLGSRFCRYYRDTYEIFPFDKKSLDVSERKAVMAAIRGCRPDIIIHLAALTSTEYCNSHPQETQLINVNGTQHVIDAAKETGARVLFASSEQVFNGNPEPGPYTETTVPKPNTEYGKSKLAAEELLRASGLQHWILRFTWVFGLPERGLKTTDNLFWSLIQACLRGEQVEINTNEYRGVTYCYDLIKAIGRVFDIPYGTYHFGSSTNLSRYELACTIFETCGLGHKFKDTVLPVEKNIRDLRMSADKLASAGITFEGCEKGIERCAREFGLYVKRF